MIRLIEGDILKANVEVLVNTVNCVGVMGKGIALQFKRSFPKNFDAYKRACDDGKVEPGKLFVYEVQQIGNPRFIVNFPTKDHWRAKSKISHVESGLAELARWLSETKVSSVAVPPLGCGLGGLNWQDVLKLIRQALDPLNHIEVLVYQPNSQFRETELKDEGEPPRMTAGRASLLGLMQQYLSALMDPYITLVELYKLMYFMQEAGEPLRLRYTKANYGPYAENLRHVLAKIEGHFITGFHSESDKPYAKIEMVPDAAMRASEFLRSFPQTQARLMRVAELVEGYETPYGMELLATVHWVVSKEYATSVEEALRLISEWNPRKAGFKEDHIKLAWKRLESRGWLTSSGPN